MTFYIVACTCNCSKRTIMLNKMLFIFLQKPKTLFGSLKPFKRSTAHPNKVSHSMLCMLYVVHLFVLRNVGVWCLYAYVGVMYIKFVLERRPLASSPLVPLPFSPGAGICNEYQPRRVHVGNH